MPLPTPQKNEGHDEFISRCMHESDLPTKGDQRLAACMDAWRKKQRMAAQHVPLDPPPVESEERVGPPPA